MTLSVQGTYSVCSILFIDEYWSPYLIAFIVLQKKRQTFNLILAVTSCFLFLVSTCYCVKGLHALNNIFRTVQMPTALLSLRETALSISLLQWEGHFTLLSYSMLHFSKCHSISFLSESPPFLCFACGGSLKVQWRTSCSCAQCSLFPAAPLLVTLWCMHDTERKVVGGG